MEEKRNQQMELLSKMNTQLDGFECYMRQLMELDSAEPVIAERLKRVFETNIRHMREHMDQFERCCIN